MSADSGIKEEKTFDPALAALLTAEDWAGRRHPSAPGVITCVSITVRAEAGRSIKVTPAATEHDSRAGPAGWPDAPATGRGGALLLTVLTAPIVDRIHSWLVTVWLVCLSR